MILIRDDWYADTDAVRARALSLPFTEGGNYPGLRTTEGVGWDQRQNIEALGFRVTYWPTQYNGTFQFVPAGATTWIHHDSTQWAAVVYLTPDPLWEAAEDAYMAPHGTALYRRRPGWPNERERLASDALNEVCAEGTLGWEPHLTVRGLYGRLLVYDARYYHRSLLPGFGDTPQNGRLTQTFFWDGTYGP